MKTRTRQRTRVDLRTAKRNRANTVYLFTLWLVRHNLRRHDIYIDTHPPGPSSQSTMIGWPTTVPRFQLRLLRSGINRSHCLAASARAPRSRWPTPNASRCCAPYRPSSTAHERTTRSHLGTRSVYTHSSIFALICERTYGVNYTLTLWHA